VPQAVERDNSRQIAGYEIGYLMASLINTHNANKQIGWVDNNWLHQTSLGHKEFHIGYLPFASTQDLLAKRSLTKSVNLVVFIGDQQFVFRFGPEVLEK
jgi:hypothetical protein